MHCLIKGARRNRKFAVTRIQYIRVHWDTEWYKWAFYLKLSKKVDEQELGKRMRSYDFELVAMLLELYIERCQLVYSLAFF